jgi:hypothetical protein
MFHKLQLEKYSNEVGEIRRDPSKEVDQPNFEQSVPLFYRDHFFFGKRDEKTLNTNFAVKK